MAALVSSVGALLAGGFAVAACTGLWPGIDVELRAMTGAGAAALGAILFLLPAAVEHRSPASLALGAAAALALAFALALAAPAPPVSATTAAALGLAAALLTALTGAVAALLRPLARDPGAALAWPVAALMAAAAAPVWLGPLLYRLEPGQAVTDLLVALSPLTHLAVAADVDYLRSDWFYRNAPFGGLRYEYPSLAAVAAGYALAGALAWAAARIGWRPRRVVQRQP
jgi:hypothetical protein